MAEAFLQDAEGVYVVGPAWRSNRWIFLCPICDDDLIEDVGEQPEKQCTTDWLRAREVEWDDRTWPCFSDPFEGDLSVPNQRKRYFHYRAIASELEAQRRRVELPGCVQAEISDKFGDSEVGFQPDAAA